jgi:phosphatidylinositol-3-phosphatase
MGLVCCHKWRAKTLEPTPTVMLSAFIIVIMLCAALGCGGGSAFQGVPPSADFPQFSKVILVVEENHGFSEVIGNSGMPYLNSLASKYGLATRYFANTHPSLGNYFMLTTGQIISNDDGFNGTVDADNMVRQLMAAGKTWKSYAESLPSTGFTDAGEFPYKKGHNPFTYFSDVVNSTVQKQNLVALPQFNADVAANRLPDFSFVVPNELHNAHDGSLEAADAWLQQNIAPLIASSSFQESGLLIITFDEAGFDDVSHGGGHIATVIVSPKAKAGYRSTTFYQHQSTLRLMLQGLGITKFPGASSNAPEMGEFF